MGVGDKTLKQMASSTPKTAPSLPPAIPPLISPIKIEIKREPAVSRTTRGITITKEPRGEEKIISQGGDLPRTSIFSFPYSSAFPSAFTSPPLTLRPVPEVFGGKGKVKVRRRPWGRGGGGGEENDPKKYSVKYLGPEKAAAVLEKALQSVKDLQSKSGLWKFTQRLEVSTVPAF